MPVKRKRVVRRRRRRYPGLSTLAYRAVSRPVKSMAGRVARAAKSNFAETVATGLLNAAAPAMAAAVLPGMAAALPYVAQGVGALGNGYLGSVGNAAIRGIGAAGNALARIRGGGDYTLSGSNPPGMGVPQFSSVKASSNGNIRFAHREYLQDIISTTSFTNITYNIQPGLSTSFPFLASIASNFEEYKMHGLVFYYRSTSGTAVGSVSTALGTVVMATQYDALGNAFTNKQEMENYQFAVSGAPCYDLIHMVECKKSETPIEELYVRTGAAPSGSDLRLYDLGVFNIATVGMQSASNNTIGELWVSYDVELVKPRVPSGQGINLALTDHFQITAGQVASGTPLGTTNPLAPVASSNLGGAIKGGGNQPYQFPPNITSGQYLFFWQCIGSATTLTTAPTITYGTNLTGVAIIAGDTKSDIEDAAGRTAATVQWVVAIAKFNGGTSSTQSTFQITGGPTIPGSVTSCDLFVTSINPGLLTMMTSMARRGDSELFDAFKEFMSKRTGFAIPNLIEAPSPMVIEEPDSKEIKLEESVYIKLPKKSLK